MTTGERIREARRISKITQQELADKLGIPFQGISQWERNLRNPKYETLQKISEIIGLPINFFLGAPPFDNLEFLLDKTGKKMVTLAIKQQLGPDFVENFKWEEIERNDYVYLKFLACILDSVEVSEKDGKSLLTLTYFVGQSNDPYVRISDTLRKLNDCGKEKAVEAIESLARMPEYQKSPSEAQEAPLSAEDETAPENKKSPSAGQ